MSPLAIALVVAALAVGYTAAVGLERRRRNRALRGRTQVRRIAFPFTGEGLSEPTLAAALRLARAEGATLMPVYLALVPLRLSVEVPLRSECDLALPMLETIERRAARAEVPVDSRIERGRTVRHALRELIAHERFDRMVVAAGADSSGEGFTPEAVAWLLTNVPGEVIVLRPAGATGQAPAQTSAQPGGAAAQAPAQPGGAAQASLQMSEATPAQPRGA
jgi:nucleotide-binding universal stress UspA family protein